MVEIEQVFDSLISLFTSLYNALLSDWGKFGSFVIFSFLIKKVLDTFNKAKG